MVGWGHASLPSYALPLLVAALRPSETDRVLAIGLESASVAAALSRIFADVFLVESSRALAGELRRRLAALRRNNVWVRCGNGATGWSEHAPYDAILVPAGGPTIPEKLLAQLATGGRLVIPIGTDARRQKLVRVERVDEDDFVEHVVHPPQAGVEEGDPGGQWMP